jgi:L-alanine-DL-glutamate epimerase-like enolase superfamily enzyme
MYPYPRYGESIASVMAQIMTLVPELQKGLTREALQQRLPAGAARNAIDCALWSLESVTQHLTLPTLLSVTLPESVVTAQTVVIGEPEQMAASAKAPL